MTRRAKSLTNPHSNSVGNEQSFVKISPDFNTGHAVSFLLLCHQRAVSKCQCGQLVKKATLRFLKDSLIINQSSKLNQEGLISSVFSTITISGYMLQSISVLLGLRMHNVHFQPKSRLRVSLSVIT